MAFLFRIPLVDFDPQDEAQIQLNWEWILKAIHYSSPSLLREIGHVPFNGLKTELKNKIIKYLIRGRYRSTPFGLWAGVGVGKWNQENYLETPVSYGRIPSTKKLTPKRKKTSVNSFKLAPGLIEYADQVHYWSYCEQEEGWRISYLDKNPLIINLLSYFKKSEILDRRGFDSFFEVKNTLKISKIWKMILESGILIPSNFPKHSEQFKGIDTRIHSELFINESVKKKLDTLISEIGNLFVPVESEFLVDFKKWFQFHYDDRFVPIQLISHIVDFVLVPNHITPEKSAGNIENWSLFNGEEELDLSQYYEPAPTTLRHVQVVFKLLGEEDIFIENMVCNREFAYSGRFSLDPEIKQTIVSQLAHSSQEAEFADLILVESSKANSIGRHSNAFSYSINPFGSSVGSNQLGTEDLLLGLRDGRLILFSKGLGKCVIPVVQHPLNPNQISHSLSRLLWEIGNQDQFRFLPYHLEPFKKSTYVPRLTWKGIILQGRRWIFDRKKFGSKAELLRFLATQNIPSPILAGHLDRELVLDWSDSLQADFIWKELDRTEELTLFECPWVNKSAFRSQSGEPLFPQIIYGKVCGQWAIDHPGFLNRIRTPNFDWVYFRIFIKEFGLQPLLFKSLPNLICQLHEEFQIDKWYYLIYQSPQTEIRLRILPSEMREKSEIMKIVQERLYNSGWVDHIVMDTYYPEIEKYGDRLGETTLSESIFHSESELILGVNNLAKFKAIQFWEEEARIEWVVNRFSAIIELAGKTQEFFNYFRNWVKQIPAKDRKFLNKPISNKVSLTQDDLLKELDSRLIQEKGIEESVRILPNHIHLCCNRLFPFESKQTENRVIYGIYKKLGASTYRLTRIKNVSSNLSL